MDKEMKRCQGVCKKMRSAEEDYYNCNYSLQKRIVCRFCISDLAIAKRKAAAKDKPRKQKALSKIEAERDTALFNQLNVRW